MRAVVYGLGESTNKKLVGLWHSAMARRNPLWLRLKTDFFAKFIARSSIGITPKTV